jgi:hypothetical protein
MRQLVTALLKKHLDEATAAKLAEQLTEGRWTADYPISVEELREMGLNVTTDMPPEILQYMNLFPQSAHRRPSVDFIPSPYQTPHPSAPTPGPAP